HQYEARKLRSSVHHLSVQYELLKHENEGLKEALQHKKKHRKKGKALDLQQRQEYHGGSVFWSPRKLREARAREAVRERDETEEKLQKARSKKQREEARLQRQDELEERRQTRLLASFSASTPARSIKHFFRRITRKMPDPNLQISLLKPEEAEQYMCLRHEVFRPTVNKILYARGEPSQKTLDAVTEDIREGIVNRGILYLKCIDTSTGEMIAGARWRYVKPTEEGAKERTWEEVDAGLTVPEPYAESDPEMFKALFALFNANKREILGRQPYYVLDTLVTLERHMRRGAGSMLVRWGCEKADEAHVKSFLEASPMGAPMYARHGFEPVKKVDLDLTKWGGREKMSFILMVRPAK
ncbi:Acetyltransf-7 multi-domain protein, partial [Pyrenophora tritici-repentis]